MNNVYWVIALLGSLASGVCGAELTKERLRDHGEAIRYSEDGQETKYLFEHGQPKD